ncbi:MAG TPA: VOC family protein [Thermoplasmata archaeon]|nr:VOC family protein [Thermoplasmata archaeon]
MPRPMWLDYAGIRVRDLEGAVRFYTEGVGLRELRRGTMGHGGIWVLLEDNLSRQRLELNWYPQGSKYASKWTAGEELDHLGFRTPDPESVAKSLVALGARLVERVQEGDEPATIYLADPDGIQLELIPNPVD